jgi:UDP-glucose 4-epimerase
VIGIFGANGFIGRQLTRRLAERGAAIRAVSRRFDADFVRLFQDRIDFAEADLRQPLQMASALQGVKTVVQLISTSSPALRNTQPIVDLQENVLPHVLFLQQCIGMGVERFVFLSSGGTVYGPDAPLPTPEHARTSPISSHGLTKLFIEKYLEMHAYVDGMPHVILRLANPYGPSQHFNKGQGLIPAILNRHRRNLPVTIFGDGLARRDYIYIDDAIEAIVKAVMLEAPLNRAINIGSGETHTVLDVIAHIERALGVRIEKEFVAARPTDVGVASLDIGLAERLLGWKPVTPFALGIAKTLAASQAR